MPANGRRDLIRRLKFNGTMFSGLFYYCLWKFFNKQR